MCGWESCTIVRDSSTPTVARDSRTSMVFFFLAGASSKNRRQNLLPRAMHSAFKLAKYMQDIYYISCSHAAVTVVTAGSMY